MDQEYYIKKWLSGSLTEEERQEFERSETYKELQQLDQALQAFKAPKMDLDDGYSQLKQSSEGETTQINVHWWKPVLQIAAAVLIGVLLFQYYPTIKGVFSNSNELVTTLNGETKEITLPDASRVTLNASSTVSYEPDGWEQQRTLDLDGEAYFKVAPGEVFTVETDQGQIQVLGTEFNVKSRSGFFEVVCYEGSVQVNSQNYQEILSASHMFRLINGTLIKDQDLDQSAPSWINNLSTFVSVPYGEVLSEFERQYNVTIESQDIDLRQLFTGSFTHQNQELALEAITQPLNIGYKIRENQIISLSGDAQ